MQLKDRLNQVALWRALVRFEKAKIASDIAIRNTIGIVIPLIAGAALGNPSAGAVGALGALNVSYSDSRDPYAVRSRRMLRSSILVGVAVALGAISGQTNITAVLAAAVWAFVAGMMVVLSAKAGDLGVTTLVTLVVFAARRLTPLEAVESGLLAVAGGLLQTMLSIAFWPVHRYEPERRIIGDLYQTLAGLAVSAAGSDHAAPGGLQLMATQEALTSLAQDHGREAERYIFLVNQAERIRMSLLTLRRLRRRIGRDPEGSDACHAVDRILEAAAALLDAIGVAVVAGTKRVSSAAFGESAKQFRQIAGQQRSAFLAALILDSRHQIDALAGQLRTAAGLLAELTPELGKPALETVNPLDRSARFAKLRANLSFDSTAFRHAIRLAVCVAAGDAIGRSLDLQRTYWLPMTIAIVLRPDFTSTFSRGILRIGGTLAGLLIATALFHFLPSGSAVEILLLATFAFLLRWAGPANYGVFVTALSAFIVLLLAVTGVSPKMVIAARAENTVLGGAIALLAYAIWPTWENTQAGPMLADMTDAYRNYFHAVVAAYVTGGNAELDSLRRKARLARSNAEALIGRIAAEPGTTPERSNRLSAIMVSLYNFVRAVLAMESGLYLNRPDHPRPATLEFASQVETTLQAAAAALRSLTPLPPKLPDLREAHNAILASVESADDRYTLINIETDRMTTSVNTLSEEIAKLLVER